MSFTTGTPGRSFDTDEQPLVSIVTPCLNAARFLERTIESVLLQDYPRIEYIVMDGGSADETVAILERYNKRLQYASAPDRGVSDAINRGFEKSSGTVFTWLNADDTYLPGAVSAAVRRLREEPQAAVVYGEGLWTDERDFVLGRYPTRMPYSAKTFEQQCGICQPAAFMRREVFEAVGALKPDLHFAFDYDLWIRISLKYSFAAFPEVWATSRMHPANISLGRRKAVYQENIRLLSQHYGYVPVNWVYGYLSYLRDGRDQFFEPLRHSAAVYLAALPVGSCYNPTRLWRYWREWANHIKLHRPSRK
jgi:glycosyltransferase involved in cell wall biosynthesis